MDSMYDEEKDPVVRESEKTPEFVEPTPAPDTEAPSSTGNAFEGDKSDENDPAVDQTDDFRNPRN